MLIVKSCREVWCVFFFRVVYLAVFEKGVPGFSFGRCWRGFPLMVVVLVCD